MIITQMMNEFPLLSLSDSEDKYILNAEVLFPLNKEYTCIGEYPYENKTIKSQNHPFKIPCGELIINKAGLTQMSSFFLSCTPGNIYQ